MPASGYSVQPSKLGVVSCFLHGTVYARPRKKGARIASGGKSCSLSDAVRLADVRSSPSYSKTSFSPRRLPLDAPVAQW